MNTDKKAEFLKIWGERVYRDYAGATLDWLLHETDFFTAPASTQHHGANPGGLLEHSLNVYHRLREIAIRELTDRSTIGPHFLSEEQEETVAVLGLLHDVCKVGVLPPGNQMEEKQGNRTLGGLPGVCIPGSSPPGPRREKPVSH